MDFTLSEEQVMFRDSVAAFARKELADGALARLQAAQSGGFGAVFADQLHADIKYRAALVPSLDGNTVEMATEQTAFAENAVKYRASLGFLTGRIQTIMSALRGGE